MQKIPKQKLLGKELAKAATPEEVAELEQLYYYGIMMMSHSVVTIFKNN